MRINECIQCSAFPCVDVNHNAYIVPDIEIGPEEVSLVVISEAAPEDSNDYYYAEGTPSYQQSTLQAFNSAGIAVAAFQELRDMGIYFTTAVKCGKTGYGIKAASIKAVNYIAKRTGGGRSIPAGSTYKIRGGEFYFRGVRAFPSYLQVGPSFGIEKSKQRMIAEDIAAAIEFLK
jgi:hypothetical protein